MNLGKGKCQTVELTKKQIAGNIGQSLLRNVTEHAKDIYRVLSRGQKVGTPPKERLINPAEIKAAMSREQVDALNTLIDTFLTSEEKKEVDAALSGAEPEKPKR